MPSASVQPAFGGTAVVCCPHNREKRKLTDIAFNASVTKVHQCACCENLFLEPSDTPMLCSGCRRPPVYALGGPLPSPKGVI